jgi:hypothetical protein
MPPFLDTFFPTRPAQERLELLAALYEPLSQQLGDAYERIEGHAAREQALRAAADASFAIPGADLGRLTSIQAQHTQAKLQARIEVRDAMLRRLCGALLEVQAWLRANVTPEGLEAWETRYGALVTAEDLMARLTELVAAVGRPDETGAEPHSGPPRPTDPQGSESHTRDG